jgi:poly-beta-1,6-N-acetyl-D-glucosamine synthase
VNFQLEQVSTVWIIISGIFLASFLVQKFFYLFFYVRVLSRRRRKPDSVSEEPVSIVICARDEAENLKNHLPVILEQDYPDFEVVVVNDCSEDDTEEVLDELKAKYPNLRSTIIKRDQRFSHGKKLAVTIGLKSAVNNWVLLTDADCRPASRQWITEMQKHFVSPREVVLGYGGYIKEKGFLNKVIRYDAFFIAMQYFSLALAGLPYMGVGRNLAYKRSLFFANRGFASHLKLESGDDDLFINETARKKNTAVEFSHLSHTISVPYNTWKGWFRQKSRHLTTGFHYNRISRAMLGLENSSRLMFYVSFILLIANKIFLPYVVALFIFRLLFSTIILNIGMNRLNEKNLLVFSPVLDIGILLFNVFCVASNLTIQKRNRWR